MAGRLRNIKQSLLQTESLLANKDKITGKKSGK